MTINGAIMAEPIKMSFGEGANSVCPRTHVSDGGTYGCHLVNTNEIFKLGGNVGYATITVAVC